MLRRWRSEDGFTLIELVFTVALLGIVATALTGVVFSYLRVSNETSTRLSASTDQQFVSTYWQQDVSSLGIRGLPSGGSVPSAQAVWSPSVVGGTFTAPSTLPGSCGGQLSAVVAFAWNDFKNAPTADPTLTWTGASPNAAVYYTATATNSNGTTQTQLWRRRCGDINSNTVIARYLTAVPTVDCLDGSGASTGCASTSPYPATVTMALTVKDLSEAVRNTAKTGYTNLVLTAQRRQG